MFKKPAQLPQSAPGTTEEPQRYERDERAERSVIDAANWHHEIDSSNQEEWEKQVDPQIYKKSTGGDLELLKCVTVGDPFNYNHKITIRKQRSQQKNWSKWKRRLRK